LAKLLYTKKNYNNTPPPCLFLSPYNRVAGDSEFIVHHSIKPGSTMHTAWKGRSQHSRCNSSGSGRIILTL